MTASDAESWARLRLVQGESTAQQRELVSSMGHTTLTVGSNVDCTWVVRDEGVRPIHFSLHWDGSLLRVADVYSAGDVRVDGTLLTSQWRPLIGRVRIEFGKAAMIIETSATSQPHGTPVEPVELKPSDMKSPPGQSRAARKGGETLIGVAPMTIGGFPGTTPSSAPPLTGYVPGSVPGSAAPPPAEPGAEPSRVARHPGNSMKATLVGGIGLVPPGVVPSTPSSSAPASPAQSTAPLPGGGKGKNATLMGFNVVDALRSGAPQSGYPVGARTEDVRGAPGFPQGGGSPSGAPPASNPPPSGGRRMTQQGVVSAPPGADPVAAVPVRPISNAPPGKERIGAAWQEMPEAAGVGGATLRGVVPGSEDPDAPLPPPPRAPRMGGQSQFDISGRLSDIPTNMRDPTTFESRKPRRGFPWRYVGVLVLTAVAYFAWLYLLDHI